MLYGNYRFTCRMETETVLPVYKGSTFRGVFGIALKRTVCALKRQPCNTCLMRGSCLYTQVFETQLLKNSADAVNGVIPHPFVIEPPVEERTHYRAGDRFECGLLLFGKVNRQLPYFIYAFKNMGEIGIGRKINGRRGRFMLESVRCNNQVVYENGADTVIVPDPLQDLAFDKMPGSAGNNATLRVELETPLRFKKNNRLTNDLPFSDLVRLMLRRASSLLSAYGNGEPALDYAALVEKAAEVVIKDARLRWSDWQRYSNRQKAAMQMGGMTGSVAYTGKLAPFEPLLNFCGAVHIGKQTAFGLGKLRLSS